jgi:hypothetical protein
MRLLFPVAIMLAGPVSAAAQEPGRMYRIAVLSPGDNEIIRRVTLPELAGRQLPTRTDELLGCPHTPVLARATTYPAGGEAVSGAPVS